MDIYINTDRELMTSRREQHVPFLTQDEFMKKVKRSIKKIKTISSEQCYLSGLSLLDKEYLENYEARKNGGFDYEDMKLLLVLDNVAHSKVAGFCPTNISHRITMDGTNLFTKQEKGNLVGLHTLKNGFTFLGVQSGPLKNRKSKQFEDIPLFYIIFWNGHTWNSYVPYYGNLINGDTGRPFGDNFYASETMFNAFNEKVKKASIEFDVKTFIFNGKQIEKELYDSAFFKLHGVSENDVLKLQPNWEMIKEDIEFRFK